MYLLVAILLIIILVFGISSGMGSYATARQAQATIEVAQVAQVNAWGNLITILVLALVIIVALGLIMGVLLMMNKRGRSRASSRALTTRSGSEQSQFTMNDLIQLEMLRTLKSMNRQTLTLPEEQSEEQLLEWLRNQ